MALITTLTRPKRIAFLIDPGSFDAVNFDEIVSFSLKAWGGRYHAIVPHVNGGVPAAWWKFLVSYDPDVVCVVGTIDAVLCSRINRWIAPLRILEGSTVAEVLRDLRVARHGSRPGEGWMSEFIDRYYRTFLNFDEHGIASPLGRFVHYNFGATSDMSGISADMRPVSVSGTTVGTFLRELALPHEDWVFPADLGRRHAAFPFHSEVSLQREGFHLVVGDTPWEWLYRWNRVFAARATGPDRTLWLPSLDTSDTVLVDAVKAWLLADANSATHRELRVLSFGLTLDELRAISAAVIHPMSGSHHQEVLTAETSVPATLSPHAQREKLALFSRQALPQDCVINRRQTHVRYAPPPFVSSQMDGFMVDCAVPFHRPPSPESRVRDEWELPRRLGLGRLFFPDMPSGSRVTVEGRPSVAIDENLSFLELEFPDDAAVASKLLHPRTSNLPSGRVPPEPRFVKCSVSPAGACLRELVQLCGGIEACLQIFRQGYTRSLIVALSGKPSLGAGATREKIVEVLDRHTPDGTVVDSNTRETIVRSLSKALDEDHPTDQTATTHQLYEWFNRAERPLNRRPRAATFAELGKPDTHALITAEILHQGHVIRCDHCGSYNWFRQHELSLQLTCPGCGNRSPIPYAPEWRFRLNSLVRNAFGNHGLLPVIDVIRSFDYPPGTMLWIAPCQDIFEKNKDSPFSDLDLCFFSGRRWGIGEVKTSTSAVNETLLGSCREVALSLEPDIFVVAAVGDAWPPGVEDRLKVLSAELSTAGIELRPTLIPETGSLNRVVGPRHSSAARASTGELPNPPSQTA